MVPAIKSLRIALLAGGVAIVAHLLGTRCSAAPARSPVRREMAIALALIGVGGDHDPAVVSGPAAAWRS